MGLIFCGGHPGQILRRLERRDPDVLEDLPIPEDYMALRVFGDVRKPRGRRLCARTLFRAPARNRAPL